jgi:hypothetical protein
MSAIGNDPYCGYRNKQFDKNYNRNNYGEYDASAIQKQNYNSSLISQDEFGQNYDVT